MSLVEQRKRKRRRCYSSEFNPSLVKIPIRSTFPKSWKVVSGCHIRKASHVAAYQKASGRCCAAQEAQRQRSRDVLGRTCNGPGHTYTLPPLSLSSTPSSLLRRSTSNSKKSANLKFSLRTKSIISPRLNFPRTPAPMRLCCCAAALSRKSNSPIR